MVLGCRRHEEREDANGGSKEGSQDVKLSSASARGRRRLLDVSLFIPVHPVS